MVATILPSAEFGRRQLRDMLTTQQARDATFQAAAASLIAKWGLGALTVTTFGLLNNSAGTNQAQITAASAVLTSAEGSVWTAADVGKTIHVQGAGAAGATLVTQIAGFTSGAQVTLANAASTTVDGSLVAATVGLAIWGDAPAVTNPARPIKLVDALGNIVGASTSNGDVSANSVLALAGSAPRTLAAIQGEVVNILNEGGSATPGFDNAAAFAAAYTALPAAGGTILLPPGTYEYASALSFTGTKALHIRGMGQFATTLRPTFAAGDSITVNGTSSFAISCLSFAPSADRNAGTYDIHVLNCTRPVLEHLTFSNGRGGLIMIEACNFLQISQVQGDSISATGSDACLRLKGTGGTISNCYLRTGGQTGYSAGKPCFWYTGTSTSLQVSNCGFAGGGPMSVWNISGIVSTGANFTVTTSATHDFLAGDFVVLRNASVAAYNTAWRVASVTATTIVVTSTLNPGAATATGTAESLTSCAYVSNADGAVNECRFANCLFEAMQANLDGTVALYFDGRRAAGQMSGWGVTGCYGDFGTIGCMISGKSSNLANFSVLGWKGENLCRAIHVESARGISIVGLIPMTNQVTRADRLVDASARTQEIAICMGVEATQTRGVTITGCQLGMDGNYSSAARSKDCAIYIAGQGLTVNDLVITGNILYGNQLNINDDTATFGVGVKIEGNTNALTTLGTNYIPSVASANTINVYPYHDVIKITGTTNIQFINPSFAGKETKLLVVGGFQFLTGGNIAVGVATTIAAGTLVTIVSDGTSWYIK